MNSPLQDRKKEGLPSAASEKPRSRRITSRIRENQSEEVPTKPPVAPFSLPVPDTNVKQASSDPISTPEKVTNQESRYVVIQAPASPKPSMFEPQIPDDVGEPPSPTVRTISDVDNSGATERDERRTTDPFVNQNRNTARATDLRSISKADPANLGLNKMSSKQAKCDTTLEDLVSSETPNILKSIKSIFRKDILTEDDEDVIEDQIHCTAYLIRNGESHELPHVDRLGLTKSHAKRLLSQARNQDWLRIFAFLNDKEMSAVQQILRSDSDSSIGDWTRRLILLQRIRRSRIKFWRGKEMPLLAIVGDVREIEKESSVKNNDVVYTKFIVRETPSSSRDPENNDGLATGEKPDLNRSQGLNKMNRKRFSGPPPPLTFSGILPPSTSPSHSDSGLLHPTDPNIRLQAPLQRPWWMIQDVSSRSILSETDAREQITTYEVYTIQRIESQNPNEEDAWARCNVVRESLNDREIIHRINELNKEGPTTIQKKASLSHNQQLHITRLLSSVTRSETDPNFQWTLAQLEKVISENCKKSNSSFSSKVVASSIFSKATTTSLIVYLCRTPARGLNCRALQETIEMPKKGRYVQTNPRVSNSQIPQPQQQEKRPDAQNPLNAQHTHPETPRKAAWKKLKKGRSKSKPEPRRTKYYLESSSDKDYDTAISSTDEFSSLNDWPQRGARGPRQSRPTKGRRRSKSINTDERSSRPYAYSSAPFEPFDSRPRRYIPEINRPATVYDTMDPVAAAYQAGKTDQEAAISGHLRSYDPSAPRAVAAPQRSQAEYQEAMNRASERYRLNTEEYGRQEQRRRDFQGPRHQRAPRSYFRPSTPVYPEYYDRSRYDVRAGQVSSKIADDDGPDIVKQLLLEWTPAEAEERTEDENSKTKISSDSDSNHSDDIRSNIASIAATPSRGRSRSLAHPVTLGYSRVDYAQSNNERQNDIYLPKEKSNDTDSHRKARNTDSSKGKETAVPAPTTEPSKSEADKSKEFSALPRRSSTTTTQPAWLDRDYARKIVVDTKRATSPDQEDPPIQRYMHDSFPRASISHGNTAKPLSVTHHRRGSRYGEPRYIGQAYYGASPPPPLPPTFFEPRYIDQAYYGPTPWYPEASGGRSPGRSEPTEEYRNPFAPI